MEFRGTLEEVERAHIEATLKSSDGNVSQAAQRLGISRGTLYAKIKQYSLAAHTEDVSA
jgi:DNA-binding NtrC family response regulator